MMRNRSFLPAWPAVLAWPVWPVLLVVLAACGDARGPLDPVAPADTAVASVVVTPHPAELVVGGPAHQYSAVAYSGEGAVLAGRSFTWSSGDTLVASVSATGVVTPLSPGSTQITAATGGVAAAASVTVVPAPVIDGSWSQARPLPNERREMPAAALDGRIYITGGFGGNEIYVAGGRRLNGANFDVLETYSPSGNTWEMLAPMAQARSGHGIGALGDRLYVFGGESLGAPNTEFASVEEYDIATGVWRDVAPLPSARSGPGVAGLGSRVHVIGGSSYAHHLVFEMP